VTDPARPVAYFDSTLEEAVALARDARDYLIYQEAADNAKLSPATRLTVSCEAMRVTTRVTQVIAWLLVQKAVHAGEMERAQAAEPQNRLGGQKVCKVDAPAGAEALPDRLTDLLDRSLGLYARVERLDALLDKRQP
jgi:regulator of CtrA degradation